MIACLLLAALALPADTTAAPPVPPGVQPFNRIARIEVDADGRIVPQSRPLPAGVYRSAPRHVVTKSRAHSTPPPLKPEDRLERRLVEMLADPGRVRVRTQLIVLLPDSIDPATIRRVHQQDKASARTGTDDLTRRRAPRYRADSLFFSRHGIRVLDRARLIQAVLVDAPVDPVVIRTIQDSLAPWFIQLRQTEDFGPTTGDGYDGNDPWMGRYRIGSDPWRALAPYSAPIALIDRQVLWDHELLDDDPLGRVVTEAWDCIGSSTGCNPVSMSGPATPRICINHGTRAAGILAGRDQPPDFRFDGVTRAQLHVYGVYPVPNSCQSDQRLDAWAAVRAIDAASAAGHRVIVAEVDCHMDHIPGGYPPEQFNAVANAAQRAYHEGSLVVAAAGNPDVNLSIAAPAVARCAIGVGAYNINTGNFLHRSHGPTPDGRTKPDLIAPTSIESSDGMGKTRYMPLDATSGAVPFVGGGAALMADVISEAAGSAIDPGQIAAVVILAARGVSIPVPATGRNRFDPDSGAGRFQMPPPQTVKFGKVVLCKTGDVCEIPIEIDACDVASIEAALWWPEKEVSLVVTSKSATLQPPVLDCPLSYPSDRPLFPYWWQTHNDVDLEIETPGPVPAGGIPPFPPSFPAPCFSYWYRGVVAASRTGPDVIERATVNGMGLPLPGGAWKLRIIANDLAAGQQVVYWAISVRPGSGQPATPVWRWPYR